MDLERVKQLRNELAKQQIFLLEDLERDREAWKSTKLKRTV